MDRNDDYWAVGENWPESLSARRAWIEITGARPQRPATTVALRKESVDRNTGILTHHA